MVIQLLNYLVMSNILIKLIYYLQNIILIHYTSGPGKHCFAHKKICKSIVIANLNKTLPKKIYPLW